MMELNTAAALYFYMGFPYKEILREREREGGEREREEKREGEKREC